MSKVDFLRRFLFPCFSSSTTTTGTTSTTTTKKRLSTSLKDDIPDQQEVNNQEESSTTEEIVSNNPPRSSRSMVIGTFFGHQCGTTTTTTTKKRLSTSLRDDIPDQQKVNNQEEESSITEESVDNNPPRSSRSMVIGTFLGHRRGHVCFCIQHDRLNSKPSLLLQLSLPTSLLVKEMKCGLVRIALECKNRSDLSACPLQSIPIWTVCINGRKVGYASRRRATDKDRLILKTMKSTTVGAGVIPAGLTSSSSDHQGGGGEGEGEGELIYMRANYERVIGNADSESFHLVNPDGFPGNELSIFLLRTR